jgi:hypothetical protein
MKVDRPEYLERKLALTSQQESGVIADLVLSPKYQIAFDGVAICVVEADFAYRDVQRGTLVAEFINGPNSGHHSMQKKLLLACHKVAALDVRVR